MISVEEELIDKITETIYHLRTGRSLCRSLFRTTFPITRFASFLPSLIVSSLTSPYLPGP